MHIRIRRWIAAAAFTPFLTTSPAQADLAGDIAESHIVAYTGRLTIVNLVNGVVVTRDIRVEGGLEAVNMAADAVNDTLAESPAGPVLDLKKRCVPGGYDVFGSIDAKNVLGHTVVRSHTDTQFWYDCKKVTSIPFVIVYGDNFRYFWRWDRTIAREKSGVGTKVATVVGAGSAKQCMNYGFGEACLNHESFKITFHLYADGRITAEAY